MRFPFISLSNQGGEGSFMPFLPIKLSLENLEISAHGLVDSGATINVLPFSLGISLGANWESQTISLQLAGNLAAVESKVLIVKAKIEGCPATELAFAWAKTDKVPLLLGQTNFFMEFDVHFFRSNLFFEITEKLVQ
jgi:hypothetical protein